MLPRVTSFYIGLINGRNANYNEIVIPMSGKKALIAIGANLPFGSRFPADAVREAFSFLNSIGNLYLVSRLWRSPAFPPGSGPDFVNAVASLFFEGSASDLLSELHKIETQFGRERQERWGARSLDLDLIAFGQEVHPDPETQAEWCALSAEDQLRRTPQTLILPHPRLQDRSFVLGPLAEIEPDWRHPLTGLTVREMLAARPASEFAAMSPL